MRFVQRFAPLKSTFRSRIECLRAPSRRVMLHSRTYLRRRFVLPTRTATTAGQASDLLDGKTGVRHQADEGVAQLNVCLARPLWLLAIVQPPLAEPGHASMALQAVQNQRCPAHKVRATLTDGPPASEAVPPTACARRKLAHRR
jgi:hypothetical protein